MFGKIIVLRISKGPFIQRVAWRLKLFVDYKLVCGLLEKLYLSRVKIWDHLETCYVMVIIRKSLHLFLLSAKLWIWVSSWPISLYKFFQKGVVYDVISGEILFVASKFHVVLVGQKLTIVLLVEKGEEMQVLITLVVNNTFSLFIKHKHENLLITKYRQLNRFFNYSFKPFDPSHVPVVRILNFFDFFVLFLTHFYYFFGLFIIQYTLWIPIIYTLVYFSIIKIEYY